MSNKRQVWAIVGLAVVAVLLWLVPQGTPAPPNDFASYWTAGRLLLRGLNPYDSDRVLALERDLGFNGSTPLVMLNPPWALPLVAPLGTLSYSTAKVVWLVTGILLVLVSIYWLWQLYGVGEKRLIGWLVAGVFLPIAVVLALGQMGPFIVFGLAAFLRWESAGADYAAGAALVLVALKPHLVFLLWPALVLVAFQSRRWKMFLTFLILICAACAVAVAIDPHAFQQYTALIQSRRLAMQENPTLAGVMQHLTGSAEVQYIPACAALLWLGLYWIGRRAEWKWRDRLPILLLVSMASVSYAWFFDQIVLLPAVLCATAGLLRAERRLQFVAAMVYGAINLAVLILILNHRTTFWYAWTATAWLLLYLWVRWMSGELKPD